MTNNLGEYFQISAEISGQRIADSTRKNYASKMKTWKKWLEEHRPQYVANSEVVLPLDEQTMLGFFGYISYKDVAKTKLRAASTIYSYYSALKFQYSERKIAWNGTIELQNFLDGYQNKVAQARETGILPTFEGKQPLSMKAYSLIASYALRSNECHYAHLYLVLCWNLMGRTSSIGALHYSNIGWSNDCLMITLPRHKGDQSGQNTKPKHIFANIEIPQICPVLALAIYCFSYGFRNANDTYKLFEGSDPEGSYNKWLHSKALSNVSVEELGMPPDQIGTHSLRKGSTTYVHSFDVVTETSVDLRAGWSTGKVRSKYVFGTPGADQLIGRLLSGLDIHNVNKFMQIQPHFHEREILTWSEYREVMVAFESYPSSFRNCLEYLISIIAHHYDYLANSLHRSHPIFSSRVWTNGLLDRLRPFIMISNRKCSCSLIASGTPTVWSAFKIFDEIDAKLAEEIRLSQQFRNEISRMAAELPGNVSQELLSNFRVEGTVPITQAQMALFFQSQSELLLREMRATFLQSSALEQQHLENTPQQETNQYPMWTWGGRLHMVPKDFLFPNCTSKALWDYWFFGINVPQKIRPFRVFKNNELHKASCQVKLKKARIFINILLRSLNNITIADIINKDYEASSRIFETAFDKVCNEIVEARNEQNESNGNRAKKSRFSQLKWATIFNDTVKYRLFPSKSV